MAASDPIKTSRQILQAGGRPHMGTGLRRCDRISCVRQVQQIGHGDRVLVGFQVKIGIPLFDLE
jgi:hypothetical protein